jgi:hypothetical protein
MDEPIDSDTIPVGPKPIRKLDQDVVNQIAASEVSIFPTFPRLHFSSSFTLFDYA